MDEVADQAGFGNATTLRHHFRSWRSTTPLAYRKTFRDLAVIAACSAAGPIRKKYRNTVTIQVVFLRAAGADQAGI